MEKLDFLSYTSVCFIGGFCITPRNGALSFTEASPSDDLVACGTAVGHLAE
jgi:hypothetical protein